MGNNFTCCGLIRRQPKHASRGRPYFADSGSEMRPNVTTNISTLSWNAHNSLCPEVDSLSPEERTQRAHKWTEAGKSEHASVASFALFAQKLLAIGAPAHLVNEALQCAQEEISHAAFAFTLASAYAGHVVAPSTYATHTMTVTPNLLQIIEDTIREGCIEETISALEANRELSEENDPAIRQALEQIVEDEAHHAAFAWKVVRWAIEREGEGKKDQKVLDLLDVIATPGEITRIGGGRYKKEDVKLLCDAKAALVASCARNSEEISERTGLLACGASEGNLDRVSSRVLQIVC